GFTALMKALYRVKAEEALHYGPVTRQSLRAACEASPTLKPYQTLLLDTNAGSTIVGQTYMERRGEFGPTLNTLLLQNISAAPIKANSLMSQAAREIESALRAGRLPERWVLYPLDPNWHLWLPEVPMRFGRRIMQGV